MDTLALSREQIDPRQSSVFRQFISGWAGSAEKTTAALARYERMLKEGIPAETILLLAPQRRFCCPIFRRRSRPRCPPGGSATLMNAGGLARRVIALFWPLIAGQAGFKRPEAPSVFLTLETSQYYMSPSGSPFDRKSYFNTITIDRNRLYSQIIDNLNKAAGGRLSLTPRSGAAQIGLGRRACPAHTCTMKPQECASRFRVFCLEINLLDSRFRLRSSLNCSGLRPSASATSCRITAT